ncbi:MAG: hypothetical protein CMM95_01860 [Rickettsiales bacterium]|nr:hypothetical protein [Rickettsiales bacterium]
MLFFDIDNPTPTEIKNWMEMNNLSLNEAAKNLGISKRQFSRLLSGETNAKRIHSLAMQMVWLINENKKRVINESKQKKKDSKKISIPIK